MKRRNFVMSVLAGGVAVPALAGQHEHEGVSGPLANATVSFGEWHTSPALDRFLAASPPSANVHTVLPFESQIKAGGAVNFVISGFHILGVYGPGTELEDVNGSLTAAIPGAPMGFPPVVNDPLNRVYRGVNPFDLAAGKFGPPLDRTEAVNFAEPGRYLVVCLFAPHFADRMHGYVNVLS
jgi:hypothetical protein